jgi:hypothetical protein
VLTTAIRYLLFIGVCLFGLLGSGSAQEFNPFSNREDIRKNVTLPKGSNVSWLRRTKGNTYTYNAPAKNFEDPIHIKFESKDGTKRPDILVWADEIQWHDDVKSGTASGRIVVDDQKEYRVETTYVEYNQLTRQLYCPRKTKIIQKNLDGTTSHMTANSVLLDFDANGIRSAKFDSIQEMNMQVPEGENNPFKLDKGTKKSQNKTSTSKDKTKETADKVVSMQERKVKKMEGVAE